MKKKPEVIKCAYCNKFTIAKFYRNKKGKLLDTYSRLQEHVILEHPEKIKPFIDQEMAAWRVNEFHEGKESDKIDD